MIGNTGIETDGYGPALFQDLDIGKKILDVLEKHYPGHAWFVSAVTESGYVTIQLMYPGADEKLRIWKFGFLMHCNKLAAASDFDKKVRNAGGEILERYGMARSRFTINDYANFLSKPVDVNGMVK